jgi:hypothetical protein
MARVLACVFEESRLVEYCDDAVMPGTDTTYSDEEEAFSHEHICHTSKDEINFLTHGIFGNLFSKDLDGNRDASLS